MSKRAAEVQLTQDNVDEEYDVSEEPGQFEVASEEQLKQRVIKKAKRGRTFGEGSTGGSIFAALKNASQPLERKPLVAIGGLVPPISSSGLSNGPGLALPVSLSSGGSPPSKSSSSPYLMQLKSLNESVSDWIKKHVSRDPYVDLTPIFKDYQTHLKGIESKYKDGGLSEVSGDESQESECMGDGTDVVTTDESQVTDTQSESQDESSKAETTNPIAADDDSLLTIRAKLFYKKESEYAELGVGSLKVQSATDNAVRLLLRNDTSVGKVLLNVRVTSDIPVSSKNNNVFIVCASNPPLNKDGSPVSYLIRVKTSQLAEKLLTTLKENTSN